MRRVKCSIFFVHITLQHGTSTCWSKAVVKACWLCLPGASLGIQTNRLSGFVWWHFAYRAEW
jgi:hypothetical protein